MISPTVLNILYGTQDIPHSTAHPHGTAHMSYRVRIKVGSLVWFSYVALKLSCADRGVVSPDFVLLVQARMCNTNQAHHQYKRGCALRARQPRSQHCVSTALAQAASFSTLIGCNLNDKSVRKVLKSQLRSEISTGLKLQSMKDQETALQFTQKLKLLDNELFNLH